MSSSIHVPQEVEGVWVFSASFNQNVFIANPTEKEDVYENPDFVQPQKTSEKPAPSQPQTPPRVPESTEPTRTISPPKVSEKTEPTRPQAPVPAPVQASPSNSTAPSVRSYSTISAQPRTRVQNRFRSRRRNVTNRTRMNQKPCEYVLNRDAIMRAGPGFDTPVITTIWAGRTVQADFSKYSKVVTKMHKGVEKKRVLVKSVRERHGKVSVKMGWITVSTDKGPMCRRKEC